MRLSACSLRLSAGDAAAARAELAAAERVAPDLPLVAFWKGQIAERLDHDPEAARAHFAEMVRQTPQAAFGHAALGRALASAPKLKAVMRLMAETYVREGNLPVARLWLDRALALDPRFMGARVDRAGLLGRQGDWKAARADLDAAVELAPFRADLRQARAKVLRAVGDTAAADADETLASALARP